MKLDLTVSVGPSIPYPILIVAGLVNDVTDSISVQFLNESTKLVTGDKEYSEQHEILKYLSQRFPDVLPGYAESQNWIEFALSKLLNKNFKQLFEDLKVLDAHLNFRTYLIGYECTVADIAVFGSLRANPLMASVLKNETCVNVSRWYDWLSSDQRIESILDQSTKSINSTKKASQTAKAKTHKANFEINLPNAEVGKVVTRFPPEPSGYLHIGHVKAAILNEYFAHAYKGKLIIRFDDTNPTKEKVEFQESIIEDLAWLGIKGDQITYSSNYFDQMYDLAVQLIEEGKAYCDDTPLEEMRAQRMVGDASARRNRPVEENVRIFTQEMKNGTEEGLKSCLRAKIDYKALNKALRDPVLYRTNLTSHHRTGTKWKMYPTYDFCVPVVDSIEGITHSLRTNEYRDRNPQYEWILKALNLRHVDIWDFGRINFVRTLLSKRKLQWFVDKKYVPNWDDPRFPTIRGVRRRGMTVEGLRNFIMSQGPSKNVINLDWSVIWALNKKVIDPIAPRFTAIESDNVVEVNLDYSGVKVEQRPKHKKTDLGLKKVIYTLKVLIEQADAAGFDINEEVTFMDWGNVIIDKIHKEAGVVKSIDARLHLEGDFRKTSKKVTWLADTSDKVEVEPVDFDHLITKDKLEEGDNFEDFLTPQTEFRSKAYADVNVRDLKAGNIIQFERKGYFRVDTAFATDARPVLYTIPDGKTVSRYGARK